MNTELTDEQICDIGEEIGSPYSSITFARAVIAADRAMQDARHLEELAAHELTVTNLRAAQGAPDGWVLAPVQPSIAACINGSDAVGRVVDGYQCADVYRAMLAAAPQPAAQPERGQIVVTKNEAGQIVAVTRQDEDGKILEVIATSMHSVSLSKRTQLEADGYVVNGVALMHPETRRRVLLDYCGFVGWWNGQVHHDQQAQQTDTVDTYATPAESASVTRQATPFESWLDEQLERIDPRRNEMGSAGHVRALTALVHELKQAQDDSPAWHDAPTCAGLWICDEASDLKYEWRAHRVTWPLNSMLLGEGERWYGPIPEDGK